MPQAALEAMQAAADAVPPASEADGPASTIGAGAASRQVSESTTHSGGLLGIGSRTEGRMGGAGSSPRELRPNESSV
jgi:hypothetical protein